MILPPNSKIQIIRGDLCKKKSDAKKLVAFICCKLLIENNCINQDLKPNSFNHYGFDSKNDEEEICEEDHDYRIKLEKVVITHKKLKRNNEEICNNYYPLFSENQFCHLFKAKSLCSFKNFEIYIYEICFSEDFYHSLNISTSCLPDKRKFGFLHKTPDLHEVFFKICPELSKLSQKTVQFICHRKVFLKEEEYYDLLIEHFFLGLSLNNNDVRFYEMLSGEKIKNSFVFNFKGKHNSAYNFKESFHKELSIFTLLKMDNSIDFDLTKKIKIYANFMENFYKIINENAYSKPEKINMTLNHDFVHFLRDNKPIDDLILQSLTNLQKIVIFELKKIKFVDLRGLKVGKYSMMERKSFLEKKLSFFLEDTDYVIYCTSLYRDFMKNLKSYVFNEKERSLTYAFPIELVIFPLGLKTLLLGQYLPFIWQQLQSLLMFNVFKSRILIPKEYACFLNEKSKKPEIYISPTSINLILYDSLIKYYQINNLDYFDLEKTQILTEKILELKKKKMLENIKYKRSRELDDLLIEFESKTRKQLHQDPRIYSRTIHNEGKIDSFKKQNFLQMKISSTEDFGFKSCSLDLNVKDLQTALTFRTYNVSDSYERLEFFGDSILKMLASLEVFFEFPLESEGFLSKKRSKIVSNSYLKKMCFKNEIYKYLLISQKTWIPNGLVLEQTNYPNQELNEEGLFKRGYVAISNKTLADVIESLTAIYYLKNKSIESAQTFLNMMGVLKNQKLNYVIKNSDENFLKTLPDSKNLLIEKFSLLEKIIGYKFKNINLLIQAFTHISFRQTINNLLYFQANEKNLFTQHENLGENDNNNTPDSDFYLNIPWNDINSFNEKIDKNSNFINHLNPSEFSYDRLEFLGDSIFDFLVVNQLYQNMLDEDPNGLSLMKAAVVNNHVLSLIALYYKFHHFLLFDNKILKGKLEGIEEKLDYYLENITVYFGENEACVKIMADVFESTIGAIFIDCGLDIKQTEKIIMNLAKKFIVQFSDKDLAYTSPLNELKKYCEERKLGIPKIKLYIYQLLDVSIFLKLNIGKYATI